MSAIGSVLESLNERIIARNVGIPHDEARMSYHLNRNTVDDFEEFSDILGDYYAHHHATCVSRGGHMSRTEAIGAAKEMVGTHYERRK